MEPFSKDSLQIFRASVAYHTGGLEGVLTLLDDIPELQAIVCDDDHGFGASEIKILRDCLHRFHRAFYYW